jgi:hypothetical protein
VAEAEAGQQGQTTINQKAVTIPAETVMGAVAAETAAAVAVVVAMVTAKTVAAMSAVLWQPWQQ